MKKKLILFCMSVFAAICCMCAFAACDIIILDDVDWEQCMYQHLQFQLLEDDTYAIVGLSDECAHEEIEFPHEYFGKPVTQIGIAAFQCVETLYKVIIPDSIKVIEAFAFNQCRNLETVIVGDQIEFIGRYAFSSTAFFENATWESDEAIYLGNYLIRVNPNLEGEYIVKEGTTVVAGGAFYQCAVSSVVLPEEVTDVFEYTFEQCFNLTSVKLGVAVKSIGWRAFFRCNSLTEIELPDSLSFIDVGAFAMTGLVRIKIPDAVETIVRGSFTMCYSLTEIVLGEGITTIERAAFSRCESLETIVIGKNLARIEDSAFAGCKNLKTIIYDGTMDAWNAIEKVSGWNSYFRDCIIQCTDGTITQER